MRFHAMGNGLFQQILRYSHYNISLLGIVIMLIFLLPKLSGMDLP